jgi:putative flippase GtrA
MTNSSMPSPQLLKFGLASGFSFCMSLGLSAAFRWLHVGAEAAFALTLVCMICVNFTICRLWVFKGSVRRAPIRRQFAAFALSSLGFRSAEFVFFLAIYTWLQAPYLTAVVLVLGTSALAKYFFLRRVVFKPILGSPT